MRLKAAIFDMDGVITDTAELHLKAWKITFDNFLASYSVKSHQYLHPFTEQDYIKYIDGRSRIDGIKSFLQSRNLKLSDEMVQKMANKKNQLFLQYITTEKIKLFNSTISFIKTLKNNQIKIAVISASENCQKILTKTHVKPLFDVIVDGKLAAKLHLKGKPYPDIFLEAAKRLSVNPEDCIVIEDAISGIMAAKNGQFSFAIGIDRRKTWHAEFQLAGADLIVDDLSKITYNQLKKIISCLPIPALTHFLTIQNKLRNKRVILFSDYDGTLSPIVENPNKAFLPPKTKQVIKKLSNYCPIVIISGRQLSDLKKRMALKNLYYAGNHGFEIMGPDCFEVKFEKGVAFLDKIKKIHQELIKLLTSVPNCLIENKKFSLSVHYRRVDPIYINFIKKQIKKVIQRHPDIKVNTGKKVFELLPKLKWDKGKALLFILNKLKANDEEIVPIYIGDDVGDEYAFKTIKNSGIGIVVAETHRNTHACYKLQNCDEVYLFLNKLLSYLQDQGKTLLTTQQEWLLSYDKFSPSEEKIREALCTLGNGYFATRGAAAESQANDIHYPGTYFLGCYNQLNSKVANLYVTNEDMVNMPNWLCLTFAIGNKNDHWFNLSDCEILYYQQTLQLQEGILTRQIRVKDQQGRITCISCSRFVSMNNPHMAAIQFNIQPENWSGMIRIKTGLDGSIINSGVPRYSTLQSKHLEPITLGQDNHSIFLYLRTTQSHIEIAQVAHHSFFINQKKIFPAIRTKKTSETIYQLCHAKIKTHETLTVNKIVSLVTNKDKAIKNVLLDAQAINKNAENYDQLLNKHRYAWQYLWHKADIHIQANNSLQQITRFNIFHLLQTASPHTINLDASVPARGLHGEAYRGHIFWDELFILPFYIFLFPDIARSLLLYRYHRLDQARYLAKQACYEGAMFPWQSGSNGEEASQIWHLNPNTNSWIPDYSHHQRHINGAIVYNIWHYYLATEDLEFMISYGAETILEVAKFWSSIAQFNSKIKRYEIKNVVGPDEYHEKYPEQKSPGIHNNAYTNIMAVWSIERALEIIKRLPTRHSDYLKKQLQISDKLLTKWHDITTKTKIPFHNKIIISQFDGYEKLKEFNWSLYQKKYQDITRLDRILKAEGDSPDQYKVSKQADVLMLFYLFTEKELCKIFKKLGYFLDKKIIQENIEYYAKRTSHGSSLSKATFAAIYYPIDKKTAMAYYQEAAQCDLANLAGGTTAEGLHLGAMGTCISTVFYRFAGISINDKTLCFNPSLPDDILQLKFNLQFHQQLFTITIDSDKFEIKSQQGNEKNFPVIINDRCYFLQPEKAIFFNAKTR